MQLRTLQPLAIKHPEDFLHKGGQRLNGPVVVGQKLNNQRGNTFLNSHQGVGEHLAGPDLLLRLLKGDAPGPHRFGVAPDGQPILLALQPLSVGNARHPSNLRMSLKLPGDGVETLPSRSTEERSVLHGNNDNVALTKLVC